MTVYFVSRHEGAFRWARFMQKNHAQWPYPVDRYVEHLDPQEVKRGDIVIGTLPLSVCAALTERGAKYLALDLSVPIEWRGQELSATHMKKCGATLTGYRVAVKDRYALQAPSRSRATGKTAKPHPAVTVMLVSEQLMPQYLGYVHEPTPIVVLVVTESMAKRAEDLERLLKAAPQPPAQFVVQKIAAAARYPQLLDQADKVLDHWLNKSPESLHINLTGGTKLMSMAFADAGRAASRSDVKVQLQYVDTAHKRIERLERSDSSVRPMRSVLGVRAAVLASGKADAGCASASERFQRYMKRSTLNERLLRLPSFQLGALNLLCDEILRLREQKSSFKANIVDLGASDVGRLHVVTHADTRGSKSAMAVNKALAYEDGKLATVLRRVGVLTEAKPHESGGWALTFSSLDEVRYLMGTWLEAHLAAIIDAAGPDDWASGVQIGQGPGKSNEIDALVTCGNRTLLIEVKTANLGRDVEDGQGGKSTKGQDALYKLDSIGHELARNFNNNWLVSARPLAAPDVARAQDKGITLFAPEGTEKNAQKAVERFKSKLGEWIKSSRDAMDLAQSPTFHKLDIAKYWRD